MTVSPVSRARRASPTPAATSTDNQKANRHAWKQMSVAEQQTGMTGSELADVQRGLRDRLRARLAA